MANKTSLRKRATKWGLVGFAAVCLWLGGKLGFFGFGTGSGTGDGTGSGTGTAQSKGTDPSERPGADARVDLASLNRTKPPEEQLKRLRVVVDAEQLLIADSDTGTSGKPADATEIAQIVKHATGDDQGIRIRIERTKRATTGARSELLQALADAGIEKEAIQEATGFLD